MLLVEDNTFVAAFISKQINGKRRKTKDTINQQLYVENNWVLKDKEKLIRFFEVLISFIILAFFFIRAFLFKHDHNEIVLVRIEGSMKGYYKMYNHGYKKLYPYSEITITQNHNIMLPYITDVICTMSIFISLVSDFLHECKCHEVSRRVCIIHF